MFPSDNPFDYPNQPIMTLGQSQPTGREGFLDPSYNPFMQLPPPQSESNPGEALVEAQSPDPLMTFPAEIHGGTDPSSWRSSEQPLLSDMPAQQVSLSGVETWNQQQASGQIPWLDMAQIFDGQQWRGH